MYLHAIDQYPRGSGHLTSRVFGALTKGGSRVQGLPLTNSGGRNGHIEAIKGLSTEIVPVGLIGLCWLCWICRLWSPNVTCFRPDSATSRQGWVGAGAAPREELRWWFRDMWWSMRRGRGRGECRFLQSRDNNKDNSETRGVSYYLYSTEG